MSPTRLPWILLVLAATRTARAEVSYPHPGVTLVRSGSAAMTITDLCAPGVGVRATRYGERRATPQQWAESIGAQVAINADFFDNPGWSYVLVRARGDGEDWPPEAQQLLQPSGYWQFGVGFSGVERNSLIPPLPWVSQAVGAYDELIIGGAPYFFGDDSPFMQSAYRRSAIGLSADRSVLYFYANGAPINGTDMAFHMIAMAAEAGAPAIDYATNEDGGGSTQLYVQGQGQVIDSGRQVNTHLGVYASGVGPARSCPTTRSRTASGGITASHPEHLDLFVQGASGLLHTWWNGAAGWATGWEALGTGGASSAPAATSWAPGRLDTFVTRPDGTLGHVFFEPYAWGEDTLGSGLASAPVATSWGRNRLDVFALAADSSLSHWAWDGNAWGSGSLGGSHAFPPAVTSWSANRLDLFSAGTDGGMWHKSWGEFWGVTGWSDWEPLGGEAVSPPAVVSWGPYRLDAVALARDGSVSHWWWNGAWGQDSLGGTFASPPALVSWGEGRLDAFAIGADGTLSHSFFFGFGWTPWENLGGALDTTAAPMLVSRVPNQIDIFAVGADRTLWHMAWNGVAWNPWESLGAEIGPGDDDAADPTTPGTTGTGTGPGTETGPGLGGGCTVAPGQGASTGHLVLFGLVLFGLVLGYAGTPSARIRARSRRTWRR